MNHEQLISELREQRKSVQSIIKLLCEISRLDQDRDENVLRIRRSLKTLNHVANRFKEERASAHSLTNWISQYESELKGTEERIRKQFGLELENELRKLGLSLSGQYPELKVGMFTIELDFDQWKATLWYGPKQERLAQDQLAASKIARQIQQERQKLGAQLHEKELLEKIHQAYCRADGTKHGEPAPIIEVLAELSHVLQNSRFLQDPKRENYRSYSRADFSYDLFRIRQFHQKGLSASKFHLTVATRAHTKRRSDFLWVPDDGSGKGTVYSHLQFKEEKA